MKKLFTLLCASAVAAGAMAQDTPDEKGYHFYTQPNSYIFYMSSNNKFVSGYDRMGFSGYVWDFAKEENPLVYPNEKYGNLTFGQLADDGTTVGYTVEPNTAFVAYPDGTVKELPVPENETEGDVAIEYGGLAYGITADGSLIVGIITVNEFTPNAAIWRNDKYELLPCPTDEELGFECSGSRADYVSADGSIIVGALIDDLDSDPLIIWKRQEDGSYKYDFVAKKYWAATIDDLESPYVTFTASNQAGSISPDGKWIGLTVAFNDWDKMNRHLARYNVETGELTVHEFAEDRDDVDITAEAWAAGIANDGTMLGFLDDGLSRIGIIWKAGSEQAEVLSTLYPEFEEFEEITNTPSAISGDGRFICGFGEKYNEDTEGSDFIGYVLDTKYEGNSIRNITAGDADEVVTAVYDLTGKKVANSTAGLEKGLYIMTTNTGRATKTIIR